MTNDWSTPGKRGIAIIANDNVLMWLLPFLESYLATNAATPLYMIPYDDNISMTRRAADIFGAVWVDTVAVAIDRLAKELYPLFPHHRRRLRKLQVLELPLDEVIYLDVDTILFRDLGGLFQRLEPGTTDFIVASSSDDYVYNRNRSQYEFLNGVRLFNDGFFATSQKILSVADFCDVMAKHQDEFHSVRKRGMLFAQPLVNFVVHRRRLRIRTLSECLPMASDESYYKADGVTFREDGPVDRGGREIYFAHWAGAIRSPRRRVFDKAWQDFSRRAAERVKVSSAVNP
jgi:hypothetical protein